MKFKELIRPLYIAFLNNILFEPFRGIIATSSTAAPIKPLQLFIQKILGFNRSAYWPCHFTSFVSSPRNIEIGIGTAPGLSPCCYIQGAGGIKIGDYTLIGPGVGIITTNHDIYDIHSDQPSRGVVIGKYCWIGMNAVILPDARLGDHTIVAAGSVVTKSTPSDGCCIIGGAPAKIIKKLDPGKISKRTNRFEYVGFFDKNHFLAIKKNSFLRVIYDEFCDDFILTK